MRDDVHGRAALAQGARPGAGDGRCDLRLARLEATQIGHGGAVCRRARDGMFSALSQRERAGGEGVPSISLKPLTLTLSHRERGLMSAVLEPCDMTPEGETMQFGLFGSAAARRGGPEFDSSEGFREFIDYNIEAEALGFHSTFVVEHHFTGYGQVSATLNLLTWLGARTRWLRLGTAVLVLPWHNPVLLAEQAATLDLLSGGRLD